MEFAMRIRAARRSAGMSQRELATRLGVTRGAVANWESDNVAPATKRLQRIAQVTRVNFEWLATGRGPVKRDSPPDEVHALDTVTETVFDPLELRLLRAFRNISRHDRMRIVDSVQSLAGRKSKSSD